MEATTDAKKSATRKKSPSRSRRVEQRPERRATNGSASANYGQAAIIGAAAAGLLAGLAMSVGRRAAVQAVSAMSGDWFESIKAEHRSALKLFDKIEATTDRQTTKRTMLLMQLKHALVKHAFEEENVLYPALRDHQERDDADHLNHDHGYVKQFLFDLEHMSRGTSAWLDMVHEFRAALEKHVREEEDKIFPQLHAQLNREENAVLTAALYREGFKLA